MGIVNIGMRDLIKELNINKNKIEFSNDLNLFLNISAFNEYEGEYYDIIKLEFNNCMNKWNIDINNCFGILSKYIKSRKLPYKIRKDEGFNMIKSERFIISMLVELYAMNIIAHNGYVSKKSILNFIYSELELNGLNISQNEIVLNELDYLFKEKKLTEICREVLILNQKQIENALKKTVEELERRRKRKIKLENVIHKYKNENEENVITNYEDEICLKLENTNLKKQLKELKREIELTSIIINEHMDKEIILQNEINKLQKDNIEIFSYGKDQYDKALIELVKNMNSDTNGNLLDRLYSYSKGGEEKNLIFLATNLFNVFREMGVSPRETIKIGAEVSIEEYSFYNFRLNKDISDIKLCNGKVIYPAWFYNGKEILKPYVNIEGE